MALKGLKYQGNCSTGMKIPDKKICGEIKTGINWINIRFEVLFIQVWFTNYSWLN